MAEPTKRWSPGAVDAQGDTEPSPTSCLNDDEVLAFAQGSLSEEARDRAQRHVDGCGMCWSLLSEAVHAVDPSVDPLSCAPGAEWATTFRPGTVVAQRYEIRAFLARGGMGEVYEAFDRQLQERVALKTVSSTACDSQRAIRDLKAEVYLARRVTHPNVCRIYDLGTHVLRNGALLYFLTMEFVEGETLGKLIRRSGALAPEDADRFSRALLQGLSAAHAAGILHRDLKSDNVVIRTAQDGSRTPIILDFGLARSLDERSRARTSNQAFVGTLTYMAPEQVEGSRLSRATDIYAFGIVWFEMLTGKLPFGGTPQMSALERLRSPPALPSQVNPAVSKLLDPIVSRCLSRAPEARFDSADAILSALPNVLGTSEVAHRSLLVRVAQVALAALLISAVSYLALVGAGRESTIRSAQPAREVAASVEAGTAARDARSEATQIGGAIPSGTAAAPLTSTVLLPKGGPRTPSGQPGATKRSASARSFPNDATSVPQAIASSSSSAAPAGSSKKWPFKFPMPGNSAQAPPAAAFPD